MFEGGLIFHFHLYLITPFIFRQGLNVVFCDWLVSGDNYRRGYQFIGDNRVMKNNFLK